MVKPSKAYLRGDSRLKEAGHRWAPDGSVRLVADVGVFERWSDTKQEVHQNRDPDIS